LKGVQKIQAEIVQALQGAGLYFFSVPNEAAGRSAVAQMQLISMGLRSGCSDLVVLTPPTVIFLEVKTPDGKQSENQKKFQRKVESMGYRYEIVRSVEDAMAVIEK